MIVYNINFWGFPLLWRIYGSAFPRAILFGGISSTVAWILFIYGHPKMTQTMENGFMYQSFTFILGFAIVFRSSLSYKRFWEARTMMQTLTGQLMNFAIQLLTMDAHQVKDDSTLNPEKRQAVYRFHQEVLHHVSLLYVLMMKHLRKDFNLEDIYPHNVCGKPPCLDVSDYVRGWRRAQAFFVRMLSMDDWMNHDLPEQPTDMPVIHGLSDDERELLTAPVDLPELEGKGKGMAGSRCSVVYANTIKLFLHRVAEGGFGTIPPLFVARTLGSLDSSMGAYGQCVKLATTQFPFPWAQCAYGFMYLMAITLPFVMSQWMEEVWMAVWVNFLVVSTYWALNEVAQELEDPFGLDPNDLPMARFAFDFNQNLISAVWQIRPEWFDECDKDLALTTTRSISMRVAAHQSMAFSPAVQELLAHMEELPNVKAGSLAAGGTVSSLEASMSFTTNAYVALVCGGIGRPVGGVWRRKKKEAVGAGAEDGGTPAAGGGRPVGEASIPSASYGWMPLTFDPCRPLSPPQALKAATNPACGGDSGSAADARSSASGMSASVVLGGAAAPVGARVAGSAVHDKPASRKASAQEEMVAALPNAMP